MLVKWHQRKPKFFQILMSRWETLPSNTRTNPTFYPWANGILLLSPSSPPSSLPINFLFLAFLVIIFSLGVRILKSAAWTNSPQSTIRDEHSQFQYISFPTFYSSTFCPLFRQNSPVASDMASLIPSGNIASQQQAGYVSSTLFFLYFPLWMNS